MHPEHFLPVRSHPRTGQDPAVGSPSHRTPFAEAVNDFAGALADPELPLPRLLSTAYAFGAACAADARPPEYCVRKAKEMVARVFPWRDSRSRSAARAQVEQATITAAIHGYYGRSST